MIYGGDAVDASAVERECDEQSDCELPTRGSRGWSLKVRLALVRRKQGGQENKMNMQAPALQHCDLESSQIGGIALPQALLDRLRYRWGHGYLLGKLICIV